MLHKIYRKCREHRVEELYLLLEMEGITARYFPTTGEGEVKLKKESEYCTTYRYYIYSTRRTELAFLNRVASKFLRD